MISRQINSENLEQYLVGLTGNICSGKSKSAQYFKELGAHVINLDEVVHDLYKKNISLRDKLYKEFGFQVFNRSLEVDREILGKIVFSDKLKLKALERIVWPYVEREREKMIKDKEGIIIIEAALLYESGLYEKFDKNLLVFADEEQQVNRLMKRDNLSKKEALKRINSQITQLEKVDKSDFMITNYGSLEFLRKNVEEAWGFLLFHFSYKKHLSTRG